MHRLLFLALTLSSALLVADARSEAHLAYDQKNFIVALKLSLPLAETGDPDMLANVGNMYGFGWGTAKDIPKAYSYWLRASEKHVPTSFANIAGCFAQGMNGATPDMNTAMLWIKKAAEHRHYPSMMNLSSAYMLGVYGLPKSKIHAAAWCGLAATNAPNKEMSDRAITQLKAIMSECTKEEIQSAQDLEPELRKTINDNIKSYKNQ